MSRKRAKTFKKNVSIDRLKGSEYNMCKFLEEKNRPKGAIMKNSIHKISGKIIFSLLTIFLLFFQGSGFGLSSAEGGESQEQKTKKAKLYRDIFPLISESDLYCSFFVLEKKELDTKIVGAEKMEERMLLREHDIFFINKGRVDGFETGQMFLILEIGSKIKNPVTREKYGFLALKRGRARIVEVEESRASARLEKACDQVMVGHCLVPFEEKGGLLGVDLGYDVFPPEGEGINGMIIYLVRDYEQIGSGHWALIDLGEEDGLQFGQQLIIYRKLKKSDSIESIGTLIVIDTQRRTSTVKILSAKDALKVGDLVKTHFK